ncbi:MAG: hypothetical protein ACQEQU_02440 [Spirochaetota bacterium]
MSYRKRIWCLLAFMLAAGTFSGMQVFAQDGNYCLSITIDGDEYTLSKGFSRELMQGETDNRTLDPVPVGWIDGKTSYIMASSHTMKSDEVNTILGYGGFGTMFQNEGALAYITVNGTASPGKVFTGELFFMHITETLTIMAMSYDLEIRFEAVDERMIGSFSGNMIGSRGKKQGPSSNLFSQGKGEFIVKTDQQ